MIVRASQRRVTRSPYLGVYFRDSRLDFNSGSTVLAEGDNYLFRAEEGRDFVLKDADNYEYQVNIVGADGAEQLSILDGQPPGTYNPRALPVPSDGSFYEFSADGYLKLKNEADSNFHYLFAYNETPSIETPGVASNPAAGNFPASGLNFKFENNKLYFWDQLLLAWKYPTVVGDASRQNAVLQFA